MAMKRILALLLLFLAAQSYGQEIIEFEGLPSTKIERKAGFSERTSITGLERQSSSVKITKSGDNYYWASRGHTPMQKISDGIYITYLAADGSGYARTLNNTAREVYQSRAPDDQLGFAMYVEHILIGLESITYYGR